jgi:hypothetical protein
LQDASLSSKLFLSSSISRIRENWQYLFLLFVDFAFFSAWSVITGIAPAGDIREHIFRTLEFAPGLSAGDYTSIQYHGYDFLAGYGVGFYAFTWILYSFLAFFLSPFHAATIAVNIMWVLSPLVLSISAVALADELGMRKSSHHRFVQAFLGAIIIVIPGAAIDRSGADPYLLSFSFSLLALVYGLRTRQSKRALIGLLIFSAFSIYSENFGYFFVICVFVGLIVARRPVLKILPLLATVCAFSWVQLLEVFGYASPYIEYVTPFGQSFLTFFGIIAVVVIAFSLMLISSLRGSIDTERYGAVLAILWLTFLVMTAAVAKASFGMNLGILNGIVDNVLPWRFLYLNFPVLLLVSVFALGARYQPIPKMSAVLATLCLFIIVSSVILGVYFVHYDSLAPASYYEQFSGDRVLVAEPALTLPESLVTFSAAFNYSTMSGAFSQGDPSFYSLTAYYEWSQYLVANSVVATNLMHLTGANELVTNANSSPDPPSSPNAIPYSQAVAVTPILLEAANASEALQFALFVNLFGKDGFILDFVTSAPAHDIYGAIVLPGYSGSIPSGIPLFSLQNDSHLWNDLSFLPLVKPFVTPPFDFSVALSNSTMNAASTIANSLIAFFHPIYTAVNFAQGNGYYSASSSSLSSSSLPIQLAVSYYPYFSPNNYSQNIYHFILLPSPERITWQLPLYDVAIIVSIVSIAGVVAVSAFSARVPLRQRRIGELKEK